MRVSVPPLHPPRRAAIMPALVRATTPRHPRSLTTPLAPRRTTRAERAGLALVELLVALVLTAIVGGALVRMVDRALRHSRGLAIESDQRAQLAVAASAAYGALESVAPTDGDLLSGTDSSVAYLATVGVAVACGRGPTSIDLAAPAIASGAVLTWWNTSPQAGDTAVILDDGPAYADVDDRWHHVPLVAVASLTGACSGSPWLDPVADAGRVGWRLILGDTLPATVIPGAPVRILRPERLALYRSGSEWMLGWTEWNAAAAAWNAIQPVAGPLLPWAPPGATSGFALQWRDTAGTAVTPAPTPSSPPRWLELGLGGITRRQVRHDGVARGNRRDSLTLRLPLRNAP